MVFSPRRSSELLRGHFPVNWIILNYLDWQLDAEEYRFVRYADDIVILCNSAIQAENALNLTVSVLADLGLVYCKQSPYPIKLRQSPGVEGSKVTHNAVHQLTQGVHGEYVFDKKGRRTQDSDTHFSYDKFDRLIRVKKGPSTWTYTYDAFNRKMSRTISGETLNYLYDGHEEIGSYDVNKNNLDLKVLSSSEGSLPVAIELKNKIYSPLIGESDGPNLYAYVGNNPACYIDRYGLFMDNYNFSCSWDRVRTNWNSLGNEIAETGYTRFQGFSRAMDGAGQCVSGVGVAAGGSVVTAGFGAPVAIPLGGAIALHGLDNFAAGFSQLLTGRVEKTLTAQLLEKTGMSSETAERINDGVSFYSGIKKSILYAGNLGTKLCTKVASKFGTKAAAAAADTTQKLITFQPKYIVGNADKGLAHAINRHKSTAIETTTKYLPGVRGRGIIKLTNEACNNIKSWEIAKNGLYVGNVSMGMISGTKNSGKAVKSFRVVLDKNIYQTSYPR